MGRSVIRPTAIKGLSVRERGQALVFALFTSVLVILAMFAMYSMGGQAIEKIKLQNTADSAAYSVMVAEARDYNFSAYTNRAMIANQVAVAQFVGMTSWFRNMSAFAKGDSTNVGRVVYDILLNFGSGGFLRPIFKSFLSGMGSTFGLFDDGRPGSTFMTMAVTALDATIAVYGKMQMIYHYSTALSVAETLGVFSKIGSVMNTLLGVDWFSALSVLDGGGNIVKANDAKAQISTPALPYLVWHYYNWFKFTELKDPNTTGADGEEADRFAQVTMDSLDDFSRDRSTKPAWGFSFFYIPPLTFIDPTVFVPGTSGPLFLPVIHRGGTELKLTDATGGGGTNGPGGDGSSGVDCNGNPVTMSGGSGGISVDYHADLGAFSASACEGDSGIVTVGDATNPAGAYAFKKNAAGTGGTWIDPSSLTNTQGNPTQTTSPRATGNRGAPGSKNKRTWTALDASSWAGIDIIWLYVPFPIPVPIPFAPPWIPLSHGAAQSGATLTKPTVLAADNNFGVEAKDAYGQALDSWTTKIAAEMRQGKGADTSLTKFNTQLGGLTKYMDVTKVTAADANLEGPTLVVEVEKDVGDMLKNPATGQFATTNGAPSGKMRSLSKAQVIFARPTDDSALIWFKRTSGSATQAELGSLYNPYWQPRLLPNNFLEKYVSMEFHRW